MMAGVNSAHNPLVGGGEDPQLPASSMAVSPVADTILRRDDDHSDLLLFSEADTLPLLYKKKLSFLHLSDSKLTIFRAKQPPRISKEIDTGDLIGANVDRDSHDKIILTMYYYPPSHGMFVNEKDGKVRTRKTAVFEFCDDNETQARNWMYAVRSIVAGQVPLRISSGDDQDSAAEVGLERVEGEKKPVPTCTEVVEAPARRPFLVIVNPVGGQKLGMKIWKKKVEPMLKEADIDVTLVVTEYADHAKQVAAELDPATVQVIVCIGGDGIVFEVVNGLMSRPDGATLLQTLPLAHIPGGTGNGLAKSVLFASKEACSALSATFVAIRGHASPLDLSEYTTQQDGSKHTSFLSFAWGLVADVDILSEGMRYLGEARLTVAGVYYLVKKKYYYGTLRMKLAEGEFEYCHNHELIQFMKEQANEASEAKRDLGTAGSAPIDATGSSRGENDDSNSDPPPSPPPAPSSSSSPSSSAADKSPEGGENIWQDVPSSKGKGVWQEVDESGAVKNALNSGGGSSSSTNSSVEDVDLAADTGSEEGDGWVTIDGKFIMIWAVQTSHATTSIYSGPGVRLDDGLFTIAVVQRMSRFDMLKLLLAMDAGDHVHHPKVKLYKCSSFSLEPRTEKGIFSLDGEVVEYGPIQAKVLPSAARVLTL